MDIKVHDQVVIREVQRYSTNTKIVTGDVISVQGSMASVAVEGERHPRQVSVDQLQKSKEVFGIDRQQRASQKIVKRFGHCQ